MLYLFTSLHYIHYTTYQAEKVSSFSRLFLMVFLRFFSSFSHGFSTLFLTRTHTPLQNAQERHSAFYRIGQGNSSALLFLTGK